MDKILLKDNKPFVFYIDTVGGQEISFSQKDEENPKMMKIDWGDGTIDEKAEATLSHFYKDGVYEHIVKVWFNGELLFDGGDRAVINNTETPVYVSFFCDVHMYCVNKFSEGIGANRLYFNINNSFNQSQTKYLFFGDDNWAEKGFVNISTELAEWINLGKMKDILQSVSLYCRNLYWNWEPLEFANLIELRIAPDPITFKTCVEYFATKATFAGDKPDLYVLPGSQQYELYQWALQYEDKFNSINRE